MIVKVVWFVFVVYIVLVGYSMENCLIWCVVNYFLVYYMYVV